MDDERYADLAQVVAYVDVAARAGCPVDVAEAVVESHRHAVHSVVASGIPVVLCTGDVLGRSSQFAPVVEVELAEVTGTLARAVSSRPRATPAAVDRCLCSWWELVHELAQRMIDDPVEIRFGWGRTWRVLERGFEDWLEHHLDRLVPDTRLELVRRQWRTKARTVADLLCAVVADFPGDVRGGDLVVVENKATGASLAHLDQLLGYVEQARVDGSVVTGVLAAPSARSVIVDRAADLGCLVRTWGELGFLDHVWIGADEPTPIRDFLIERGIGRSA